MYNLKKDYEQSKSMTTRIIRIRFINYFIKKIQEKNERPLHRIKHDNII